MPTDYKHITRDIEVKVLEEGDNYVKFEILKYDKSSPHLINKVKVGDIDILSRHQFNVLFKPKKDNA